MMNINNKRVAVIGATGYVGGRLVDLLCESGYQVRAVGRSLSKMRARLWANQNNVELACADVYDKASLLKALDGVDAAYYLVHSMNPSNGETYDIGGSEVLTYRSLMDTYAEEAGLRPRIMLPVPVLTPRLSSYWIHLITPISASIARPLAEGLKNPVICKDNRIKKIIPQELFSPREAIALAIKRLENNNVITHWADARCHL